MTEMEQTDMFGDGPEIEVRFNGDDYQPERDDIRLKGQLARVWECMKDGRERTLSEIAEETLDPEASISAQLRHLRKKRFGSHKVEKIHLGQGLYHYKLTPNPKTKVLLDEELND